MNENSHKYQKLESHIANVQENTHLLREKLAPAIKAQAIMAESMRPSIEAQNRLQESLGPIIKAQLHIHEAAHDLMSKNDLARNFTKMAESMRPFIEAQKRLQESLGPIIETQLHIHEAAHGFMSKNDLARNLATISSTVIEFQSKLKHLTNPAFVEFQKSFRELPKRTRSALITLGKHGWFLDLEMPLTGLWEIQKALDEGDVDEVEKELVEYFTDRLKSIEESIIDKFPHRTKLIRAAFRSHARGEYELSIPVILSQTDGICHEVIDQYFFLKKNKKPKTALYVEKIVEDTYRAALLEPLAQSLPIGASQQERHDGFSELNRHMVLHGESLDYGTEINSLKAISLVNYVCHVLKPDEDEP